MRARWFAVWLAATGCDRLFHLEPTHLPDAAACATPDEDGDCIVDQLDNCPGLANPDQTDDDMDGVGNICDPDETSQQVRLSFSPFTGADLSSWQASTPAWTIDPAAGVVRHGTAIDTSLFGQNTIEDIDDVTVEATFIYHASAGTSPPNRLGVWVDTPMGTANGQACWIDPSQRSAVVQESITDTGHGNTNAIPTGAPRDGDRYTVQLRRVRIPSPRLDCSMYLGSNRTAIPSDAGTPSWLTGGYVAISADGVRADLLDVVIYGPSL